MSTSPTLIGGALRMRPKSVCGIRTKFQARTLRYMSSITSTRIQTCWKTPPKIGQWLTGERWPIITWYAIHKNRKQPHLWYGLETVSKSGERIPFPAIAPRDVTVAKYSSFPVCASRRRCPPSIIQLATKVAGKTKRLDTLACVLYPGTESSFPRLDKPW
jgi:hypothetical protein